MQKLDPYKKCPVVESEKFIFRQVQVDDANDLLECYSDKEAVKIFNSDNCPIDFYFDDLNELKKLIDFWLMEYSNGGYVRFAVVDKYLNKAVGSIEIFAKKDTFKMYGSVATLRLDLSSKYENEDSLTDILNIIEEHFGNLFNINSIITKAIPYARQRVKLLLSRGYILLEDKNITSYDNYYIRKIVT